MDRFELREMPANGRLTFSEPIEVDDSATLSNIFRFREKVWRQEAVELKSGLCASEGIKDEHDHHAHHWIITLGDEIVAAARLCIHRCLNELPDAEESLQVEEDIASPIASLNRLVVATEARRHGLARVLDNVRIQRARDLGAATVVGTPMPWRVESLRRLGFQVVGLEKNAIWGDGDLPFMVLRLQTSRGQPDLKYPRQSRVYV